MALIKCPNCGKDVSDKAKKCPNCGTEFENHKETSKNDKLVDNNKVLKIVIVILMTIIVVMGIVMFDLLGKKDNVTKSDTESNNASIEKTDSDGSRSKSNTSGFQVNKQIFDDEHATIVCKSIDTQGVNFEVTSKMENRNISLSIENVSLDGLVRDLQNYYQFEVKPGEKKEYILEGNVKSPEHKLMSLSGYLFDDNGLGFAELDICDFDIGGKENEEYKEKEGKEQFASDNIEVKYIGSSGKGIEFTVKNKKNSAINVVCESLTLNDKKQEPNYGSISVPGHSTASYYVDVISGNPDLLPENIETFAGTMYTWGENGTTEDKFEISSDK